MSVVTRTINYTDRFQGETKHAVLTLTVTIDSYDDVATFSAFDGSYYTQGIAFYNALNITDARYDIVVDDFPNPPQYQGICGTIIDADVPSVICKVCPISATTQATDGIDVFCSRADVCAEMYDYFNRSLLPYMDVSVYSIGDRRSKLYTWEWGNITNNTYPEDAYTVRFGVSDNASDDGLLAGSCNYTELTFASSYTDLWNNMSNTQQAVAEANGYFFVVCLLLRYNDDGTELLERCDKYTFAVYDDGSIQDDGGSTGDVTVNEDTNPYSDDTFPGDGSSFDQQAPGQAMSVDNLLTSSYTISESDLQAFGQWLWANNLQQLEELQTAPIENILSCKRIPFAVTGTASTLKLGNISVSGISVARTTASHVQSVGSVTVPTYHGGDYIDATNKISIYLPYCGVHSIPTSICYAQTKDANGNPHYTGRTISVTYYYDVIYGTCIAALSVNGNEFAYYNGTCGIDIPVTSSNRASNQLAIQKEGANAIVGTVANTLAGAATGGLMGAMGGIASGIAKVAQIELVDKKFQDTHYTTSGGFSSQVASFVTSTATLFVESTLYTAPSKYGHQNGYPTNLTLNLSSLKGYTELEGNMEIDSIPCLDEERDLLQQALSAGFYL